MKPHCYDCQNCKPDEEDHKMFCTHGGAGVNPRAPIRRVDGAYLGEQCEYFNLKEV